MRLLPVRTTDRRRDSRDAVRSGTLHGELPFLAFGSGPVLVVLPGLEAENANPVGRTRAMEVRRFGALAAHFTVYVVRRRPGLAAGCTMADLAADNADALAAEFGEPVDVQGVSTGGSVAQQLAIDHPHRVRKLVLLASACRLSASGRALQRRHAHLVRAGDYRRAWALMAPAMAAPPVGTRLAAAGLWLAGPRLAPTDPTDLLRTIEAEDSFDVTTDLPRLTAPTLVLGGARDVYYSPELFRRTAATVPHGELRLCWRKGHAGTVLSRQATIETVRFLSHEDGRSR